MFPQIVIAGAAEERGRQYGEQAAALIRHSIASYARVFAYRRGLDWQASQAAALAYLPLLDELTPDLVAEMRGIAQGSGRHFAEILALNVRTELLAGIGLGPAHPEYAPARERNLAAGIPDHGECTTIAALPEATADGSTLLAQTWDWTGDQRAACLIVRIQAAGEPEAITVTEAGIMAKIGLNAAGVGVALNILRSRADGREPGMPVHVLLRAALQAHNLEQVQALAERAQAGASSCVTVADDRGRAASLEITPGGVGIITPEDGILAHTNHCLADLTRPGETPIDPASSSVPRFERAHALLASRRRLLDTTALIDALRDHQAAPLSICRHPDTRLHPLDRVESVLGVVLNLSRRELYVAPGVPCQVEFSRIALDGDGQHG